MSVEYIIVAADRQDCFLTWGGNWSAEYPTARIFPNLQSAHRARDAIKSPTSIYSTKDYQAGNGPKVAAIT